MSADISSTQPVTLPVAPYPSSTKTFLGCTVENLDPGVIASHSRHAFWLDVASKATLVVYTVLAVTAFVATGILLPAYVQIVGIGAIFGAMIAWNISASCTSFSYTAASKAAELEGIAKEYKDLTQDPNQLVNILRTAGVAYDTIPGIANKDNLTTLRPLIALYNYRKKQSEEYKVESERLIRQAATVDKKEESAAEKIRGYRTLALDYQEGSRLSKVNAAFTLAVINSPRFVGEFTDVATFKKLSFEDRALARQCRDPSSEDLIVFNQNPEAPLKISEVENEDIKTLAQRFIPLVKTA